MAKQSVAWDLAKFRPVKESDLVEKYGGVV